MIEDLERPLRFTKGVGEKLSQLFARKEIRSVGDALYNFPRTYEDRRRLTEISQLQAGEKTSVIGKVKRAYPVVFSRSRRRAFEVLLEDVEGAGAFLVLTYFNASYLQKKFQTGAYVMATGQVQIYRNRFQMVHPDIEVLGKLLRPEERPKGILPVYSETAGLHQKTIRRIEKAIVTTYSNSLKDTLPEELRKKYGFPSLSDAICSLHCPSEDDCLDELREGKSPAHRRLIYEEFFRFSLNLLRSRNEILKERGIAFPRPEKYWERLKQNLPFSFTAPQRRVLHEILSDMTKPQRMHRLIQGDVGSGKTVVAAAAALVALEAGFQVAMMAPTEILAHQHFENIQRWFKGLDLPLHFLSGSKTNAERAETLKAMATEKPYFTVGTHALFEKDVSFARLGLVIVDEQHRFGVRQRQNLASKGLFPDLLVMTATPIPRTLALTLYGDLDISVIDEKPPGRKEIKTKIYLARAQAEMDKRISDELAQGRQVYWVYPLIEENDELDLKSLTEALPEIEKRFPGKIASVLHGKMKDTEKRETLRNFKNKEIDILLSTTVVEVGVDVPNASVMVIEHAERFGLSQLHQLRGRIGRGEHASYCFLVPSHLGTPEIVQRLRAMESTEDGFRLAEIDLEMRGSGDFLGTKQSGFPAFQLARLPRDLPLLSAARSDAESLLSDDPELEGHAALKSHLEALWARAHLS